MFNGSSREVVMEKIALKLGGVVFVLIGLMHAWRVIMKVPVKRDHALPLC